MPVKLRLRRQGRKAAPHYAIVAADSRAPRDGKFIEKIGFYNPITEPAKVFIEPDLAIKWLKNGAQPTNTVRALLRHAGVTLKYALIKQGKSEEEMEKIYTRWLNEKLRKKKKKVVMVDRSGRVLSGWAPVTEAAKEEVAATPAPEAESTKEEEAPAAEVEEAPAVEETPTVEDAPTAEEAPAAEASEEAPQAEEESSEKE